MKDQEPEGVQMANRILRRDELVSKIPVNKANLLHIAETGKINGSLHQSICDLLLQETHLERVKVKDQEWVNKYNDWKPDKKTVELIRLDTKTILQAKEIESLKSELSEAVKLLREVLAKWEPTLYMPSPYSEIKAFLSKTT